MSFAELMQVVAPEGLFADLGESIARAPEQQGVPFTDQFLAAWKGAAAESFVSEALRDALTESLKDKFTEAERAELGRFFRSPFGLRIVAIENDLQLMPADVQLAARDAGLALLEAEPDGRRAARIDEILDLASAEIGRAMLAESMRVLMAGIAMSGAQGDIVVPWEEIDAQLAVLLPALEAEVLMTQRGLMAYAYQDLTDAELDTYMQFLRTDVARKLFAALGFSVGIVVHEAMMNFSDALAERVTQVAV